MILLEWSNAPDTAPKDKVGMVYYIKEKDTGKGYIGIKKFWKKVRRKPLKGKKRMRLDVTESDWRKYNSSNKELQEKIKNNPDNYEKFILYDCDTVVDMKAREAYLQLETYFNGEWGTLYNEMINLRLRIRK